MTRAKWILLVFLGLALSSWLVLSSRATTRQGVNFRVQALEIPLYLKLLDFFVRDRHYGEIAERITKGVKGDEEKVQAVFEWTRKHILPIPAGMPAGIGRICFRVHSKTACTFSSSPFTPLVMRSAISP